MRESDLVATMTVHYASDGEGAVVAGANTVSAAQDRVAASSQAMATATESASRRQVSAAAAFDALSRRMDPAARAFADLERNQTAYNRALSANSSIVDKAGQGLDVYATKLKAAEAAAAALMIQQENMRRQQSNLTTDPSAVSGSVKGSPISLNQITGSQLNSVNVRDYAAQFEAAAAAQEQLIASANRVRAALNPLEAEQGRLAAEMSGYKKLLDAGAISQDIYAAEQIKAGQTLEAYAAKLNTAALAVENLRRQQSNLSTNTAVAGPANPTQITGTQLSNVNVRDYAAQFEAAAAAQDEMVAASNRLRASLNPLAVEEERVAANLEVLKSSLDATLITEDQYAAAQLTANQGLAAYAEKLNAASVAAENLRRQQANASVNQGTGFNPGSADTNTYAAQFEAAAAAQDAMIASTSRLRAELNPLEVEQGRLASELGVYKTALDAGRISQSLYTNEQAKAGQALAAYADKLNSAATAAEHLRRQQSNLSTNTTVQGPANPTQITGAQLSNVNVRDYAAQFEAAAAAQDAMTASTARLVAALNPFEAEQGRLATQLSEYKAALDAGRISQQVYTAEQEKAGQTLAAYAEKLNSAALAAENLRRQNSNLSTNTTVAGPANPTQILGTKLSNVNTSEYAAQFEAAAKAQDDMVAASNRLKAALNPLAAEEAKQAAELTLLKEAQVAGIITAEQFAGAQQLTATRLANLSQSLKTAGTAGRVMSGEMTNLGFQLNDVITGLALGQSPFMILGQQGGQIIQIFANSKASIADFARSSVSWLTSLITPMTATIAGAVAAAAAIAALAAQYDKLQVSSQRALIGAGERTGTTVTDLNKFVEQNSGSFAGGNMTTGLSNKESRALAEDLTKTGEIVISKLHGMSDAVVGFANQTGQSMDDARKAFVGFAVDPKKGMEELAKVFGDFDVPTRNAVDDLVRLNDKTAAFNVVLDAVAEASKKAAENMTTFEMAARGAGNVLAKETVKPSGIEVQFDKIKNELNAALEAPADMLNTSGSSKNIELLSQKLADLQQAIEKVKAGTAAAELAKLSTVADGVVASITPEIAQLDVLRTKLEALDQLKAKGGASKQGAEVDTAARIEIQNVISKTEEAQAATARYNKELAVISLKWGDVGQATALALQAAQNQLPVIEAVGEAAKMAAQQTADFKNAMDQGKSATEATALAASNLAASMAQVNAAAQEQLFALQNGLQVSQAWTAASQMRAQQQATYNQLLHQGVTAETAGAVAAAQYADSKAKAEASAQKLVQSSADNLEKIQAQGTGMEAVVASSIAYRDAIQAGATATQAAAIAADTLQANMLQAAQNAQRLEQAQIDAVSMSTNGVFDPSKAGPPISEFTPAIMPKGPLSFSGSQDAGVMDIIRHLQDQARMESTGIAGLAGGAYATGGIAAALDAVKNAPNTIGANSIQASLPQKTGGHSSPIDYVGILGAERSTIDDKISTYDQLVQLQNSQTADKGTQVSNLQSEMAWLQTLPTSIARDQKITSLQQSIDQLKQSTDGLNSTMGDLLSPYYTQDPRTSHIGFRSQGMASGGSFVVPGGYSSNDNMVGQIPLASGEVVSVSRSGESGARPINIHQTINIQGGANRDEVRRTQYHNGQNLARQLRASAS